MSGRAPLLCMCSNTPRACFAASGLSNSKSLRIFELYASTDSAWSASAMRAISASACLPRLSKQQKMNILLSATMPMACILVPRVLFYAISGPFITPEIRGMCCIQISALQR